MADKFTELIEDWDFVSNETGQTGVRKFYRDAAGTKNLPEIGDGFTDFDGDEERPNCKLRSVRENIFYPDRTEVDRKYAKVFTLSYNSRPTDLATQDKTFDPLDRRFTLGGEIISMDNPKGWVWEKGGNTVEQPVFIANAMGTFTRQIRLGSDGSKRTWIQDFAIPAVGAINALEFEDFRIGQVLFSGFSGGTQFDNEGRKRWIFDCEFTYRVIKAGGPVEIDGKQVFVLDVAGDRILDKDWHYVLNRAPSSGGASTAGWDRPKGQDGSFLYPLAPLEALFGPSENP